MPDKQRRQTQTLARHLAGLSGLIQCQYIYVIKSLLVFPVAFVGANVGVMSCHCSCEPAALLIAHVCVRVLCWWTGLMMRWRKKRHTHIHTHIRVN